MAIKAPLASAVALTTSDVSSVTANIAGSDQHTVYVEWTPGTSGNVLTVKLWTRADSASQWTQEQEWDGSGTKTRTLIQYQHTATGTTVVPMVFSVPQQGQEFKITFTESEAGGATKGTITATLFSKTTS